MRLKEYVVATQDELRNLSIPESEQYYNYFKREGDLALGIWMITVIAYNKPQLRYALIPTAILTTDLLIRRFGIDLNEKPTRGLVGKIRELWQEHRNKQSIIELHLSR